MGYLPPRIDANSATLMPHPVPEADTYSFSKYTVLLPYTQVDWRGTAYLAGTFPGGITTVEGQPGPATIRVHYRPEPGAQGDGMLVAETTSAADGTWLIENLNPDLKFDVICRHEGYNDMILSNVSPVLATGLEFEGEFETLDDQVRILFGTAPYQVAVVEGAAPPGVTFKAEGDYLVAAGVPTEFGDFYFAIRVVDANGVSGVLHCVTSVAKPLPTIIGESFGGGFYAGNIVDGGVEYALIVADVSADIDSRWKTERTATAGTDSLTDGPGNTQSKINAGIDLHPAARHCIGHNGGGNSDWYMPAEDELGVLYLNLGFNRPDCPPDFSSGGPQAFASSYYWASTQGTSSAGRTRAFWDGTPYNSNKNSTTNHRVRPVRRLPITSPGG